MARKVIEEVTCDACTKKGVESAGTVVLSIEDDRYDLCDEHGERFRKMLRDALGPSDAMTLTA